MAVVHLTRPGTVARFGEPRPVCDPANVVVVGEVLHWNDLTGVGEPVGDIVHWDDLAEPGEQVPTCPDCVEDIRANPRPRWLDERLFP